MSNKSITESTIPELIERKKKHLFVVHLIDTEIARRKGNTVTKKSNPIIIKKASPKKDSTKKASPKKNTATRDDMKAVLKRKHIDFKSNANKAELLDIVRKHNLVRTVDEYHMERSK